MYNKAYNFNCLKTVISRLKTYNKSKKDKRKT